MYTLKIENASKDILVAAQALIQENRFWASEIVVGPQEFISVEVSTRSIKELKRLVDLLESEEFMRYE